VHTSNRSLTHALTTVTTFCYPHRHCSSPNNSVTERDHQRPARAGRSATECYIFKLIRAAEHILLSYQFHVDVSNSSTVTVSTKPTNKQTDRPAGHPQHDTTVLRTYHLTMLQLSSYMKSLNVFYSVFKTHTDKTVAQFYTQGATSYVLAAPCTTKVSPLVYV